MGKYWICICLAWGLGIGGCTPVQQYRYTEGKIYFEAKKGTYPRMYALGNPPANGVGKRFSFHV